MNGGTTQFNGRAFAGTDTLVKYTYYGDTDFNGRVNFDDYVRTDNGFNNHLTGWMNGDFDHNGQVNFDDYVLIDLAFNTQSGTLGRVVDGLRAGPAGDRAIVSASGGRMDLLSASAAAGMAGLTAGEGFASATTAAERMMNDHLDQFGEQYRAAFLARAVPEPTAALSLIGLAAAYGSTRRRRRNASV